MKSWTKDRLLYCRDVAIDLSTPRNLIVVALAVLVAGSYCAGKSSQKRADAAEQYAKARAVIHDTLRVVNDRLRVDTVRVYATSLSASKARVAHDSAASRIAIVNDSTVRVDHGQAETEIPASVVIPELRTCNAAIVADTLALHVAGIALRDAVERGDYEAKRADLAEQQVKRSHPRFGWRSGFIMGGSVVAILAKVLR